MFRDFVHHTAWTDAMRSGRDYVGLIEYQPKYPGAEAHVLWVVAPGCVCEADAETLADNMLDQIADITPDGDVIYRDGVRL